MTDPSVSRHVAEAKAIYDAAWDACVLGRMTGFEAPDPGMVHALAQIAVTLLLEERRGMKSGSIVGGGFVPGLGQHSAMVIGWHVPGHVDERGAPVVLMLPSGQPVVPPSNAFLVGLLIPAGREADIRKTFPTL